MANQGTIYHWSRDHRVHHKYSETEAGNKINCDDLLEDWVVRLQKRLNPWGNLFMSFVFPMLVSMYYWEENWMNGLLVAGFFRYVFILHCTWLVNSAAHFYGETPYDPNINPTENSIVAVLAMGEGWHNWHHVFPYDYAASEFGVGGQYNPTKLFIDACAKVGLVTDRKRALHSWEQKKLKREVQDGVTSEGTKVKLT